MGERPNNYRPAELFDATITSPETPRRGDLSPKDQKRAEVYNTLLAGVEAITQGDGYRDYLKFMAKLHDYSWGNIMLIQAQRPDASQVAGYNRWKELGRQVKKGEKGIAIMVPHKQKIEDEESGESYFVVKSFGIGYVFDQTQTDGEPLPEPPQPKELRGNDPLGDELFSRTSDFVVDKLGVSHRRDFLQGHARGSWNPNTRTISLKKGLYADQEVKTFVHEAIHAYLDHKGSDDRDTAEAITESAAFVTLSYFGMDTRSYSFPYVAGWAKDLKTVTTNLRTIQQTSNAMIHALE